MNDTETEARRLFAAATEDMPPGIDLLGGFAAARRRDRSRRTRRGALLSAGIAAAAASVTAVALTMGSAPPTFSVVTSALTRTLAQSYHLSEQDSYYYLVNGQIRSLHHDTCTTEADPVQQMLATSCPSGIFSREVGGYTYIYSQDSAVSHPGKHWLRMPTASTGQLAITPIGGFVTAAPQQMLDQIKEVATVTVAGSASGPGWTGTRYAFSATLNPGTIVELSGTVTVDRQGRARALTLTMRFTGAPGIFPTLSRHS